MYLVGCVSQSEHNATSSADRSQNAADKGPVSVSIDDKQKQEIGLQVVEVKQGLVYKTVESPGRVGPNAELSRLVSTPSAGRAIEVRAKTRGYSASRAGNGYNQVGSDWTSSVGFIAECFASKSRYKTTGSCD